MEKRTMKRALSIASSAVLIITAIPALAQPKDDDWGCGRGYGPGMMGGGYGYGPGMMGRGGMMEGPGGCGPCWGPGAAGGGGPGAQREDLKLSVDQVRNNMDGWLKRMGNARLKLGKVVERDADTITADVVTAEKDVVVQRYEVNRHSGFVRPAR
ncbi:hypothetical protein OYT13_11070 [Pandoraea sp. XJJ-1]|uniref:Uncharacterized protein n=1 Tax=Pandoraea cepalis TaxID=2508294 RepID=A0A5E4URR7_9BURK|nr:MULTISPECIES: hypothetical protein [Pandoraea]WAL84901.1 hypothetical protein OYT13_11070 [Pandoraea sp. XJJ-1]VVE01120.1 hypothetical protein PCE31107_02153 [Pandoraea cepalis]VVE20989.1 hypothetical protein PCE31106_03131 [Pandoraea cepalis]